jgi:propanol-preferring alcohol dehydrogenase
MDRITPVRDGTRRAPPSARVCPKSRSVIASRCRGRLRLRHLRLLRLALGDALPRAEEHGLLDRDGGFGEYAIAYARYVKVPEGIDPFDAAPLTCAGVTTYKAVRRPGDCRRPDRREAAAREGARRRVHGERRHGGSGRAIQKLGGADQAIALAVSPKAFEQAYSSLRRGGTLVFVALPPDNQVTIPIFETVLNGITIVGSIVGTRTDLREVFQPHAAGKTSVIRETRPLDQVNQAIADVEAGRVPARIALQP